MSELLNNAQKRKALLKEMILKLHEGETVDAVKVQLTSILGKVPYGEVIEVEQELIREGFPQEEILKLCDLHSKAMRDALDTSGKKTVPDGHPVDVFQQENLAIEWEITEIRKALEEIAGLDDKSVVSEQVAAIRRHFYALTDVDKHYRRKENLLFPYLEKLGIDGPPTVMWGKDDEIRNQMKSAVEALSTEEEISAGEAGSIAELFVIPALEALDEMIYKEENILFPMALDKLTEGDWYEIDRQTLEIGFCLYDPQVNWAPDLSPEEGSPASGSVIGDRIQLPSGSMIPAELTAMLNSIPFDLTFVDAEDTVRYFTQGRERIFDRNRAILGRKVQFCHPPSSVHIVQKIIDDFKSGRQDSASFWLELKGRFIMIEYYALRSEAGEYLGTLEVSQDLTEKRAITGERRLLSYNSPAGDETK